MNHQLSKSEESLQKEAEIQQLQTEISKKNSSLKRLQTRLQNTQQKIENIQRKVNVQLFSKLDHIQELREEIIKLAEQLKEAKGIKADELHALDVMIDDLIDGEMFGEMFHYYQEQKEKYGPAYLQDKEEERAKMQQLFAQFQVQPDESEQRDIRKLFLGLSKIFHPDRAKDKKEKVTFHNIMLQINEAYQNNDVYTLLELDNTHNQKSLDLETHSATINSLQLHIDRLQRELTFIENQIERTSHEIKNLRASELGQMESGFKKAERRGEGFDEVIAGFEEMVTLFSKMRDGLKDSIKRGELSPLIIDMLVEDAVEEATLQEFMEMMGLEGLEDLFEEFDDFGGGLHHATEVDDPQYPIGSSVQIAKPVKSPYLKTVNMQGWEGRVLVAYYEGDDEEKIIYEIAFDSKTMEQFPKALIERTIKRGEDFQTCAVEESLLAATKPRDTQTEAFATYRKYFHKYNWGHLPSGQQKRLQSILLQFPDESDTENWTEYFEKNLPLPFKAQTRDMLNSEVDIQVKVTGFQLYDDDYGHIVKIVLLEKGKRTTYPLAGLKAMSEDNKTAQILDDYLAWGYDMLVGLD